LELDVDPEEFDPLEPRVREGLPVLQVADFLANGAGFSRRLAHGERPLVLRLISGMVQSPRDDKLVARYFEGDHPEVCKAACYRCLQRFGNRSYHGLLDWRLGLSALRAFIQPDWQAGLDGQWNSAPELVDWRTYAEAVSTDIAALTPDDWAVGTAGRLGLPTIQARLKSRRRLVFVHPLWSREAASIATSDGYDGTTMFVDTFHAHRRPQRLVQMALEGAFD
jgi:hypothetical protein